jgi:hypothetical protein
MMNGRPDFCAGDGAVGGALLTSLPTMPRYFNHIQPAMRVAGQVCGDPVGVRGFAGLQAVLALGVPIGRIDSVDFGLGESRGARGPYTPSRLVNYSVAQETAGVAVIRLALGPRAGRERWVRAMVTLRGSGRLVYGVFLELFPLGRWPGG